jgi:hypothetical protein
MTLNEKLHKDLIVCCFRVGLPAIKHFDVKILNKKVLIGLSRLVPCFIMFSKLRKISISKPYMV